MATLLGGGIIFPIELENGKPPIRMEEEVLVTSSIKTILGWPIATKYLQGQFGSKNEELLEEPNDQILAALAEQYAVDAIRNWEPRVASVNVVAISNTPDALGLQISINLRSQASSFSFIYPFYKNRLL